MFVLGSCVASYLSLSPYFCPRSPPRPCGGLRSPKGQRTPALSSSSSSASHPSSFCALDSPPPGRDGRAGACLAALSLSSSSTGHGGQGRSPRTSARWARPWCHGLRRRETKSLRELQCFPRRVRGVPPVCVCYQHFKCSSRSALPGKNVHCYLMLGRL